MSSTHIQRIPNQTMLKPPSTAPVVPGINLIAMRHDEVRIDTVNGPVAARFIKIIQFAHAPAVKLRHHRRPLQLNASPLQNLNPQRKSMEVHSTQPGWIKERHRNQIALRAVGEVLSDENGKLYEVRNDEIHLLGKLVRNQRGRLFEICDAPNADCQPRTAIKSNNATAAELTTKDGRPSTRVGFVRRLIKFLQTKVGRLFATQKA